jgi:hypothetical protein
MPVTGWRLSDNIVDIRGGVSDEQIDQFLQDVLIAGALSEYFDLSGVEVNLNTMPYCYSLDKQDNAIVVECPLP